MRKSVRQPWDRLERQIDDDYLKSFPADLGWETSATSLLLDYNVQVTRNLDNPDAADHLKYAAMHAMRWGRNVDLGAIRDPLRFAESSIGRAHESLVRGFEYVEVFGMFVRLHRGDFKAVRVEDDLLEVTADPGVFAHAILSKEFESERSAKCDAATVAKDVCEIRDLILPAWNPLDAITVYQKNAKRIAACLSSASAMLSPTYELPETWKYQSLPIGTLRRLWEGLFTISQLHFALSFAYFGSQSSSAYQLLCGTKGSFAVLLGQISETRIELAADFLSLLIYDRTLAVPDIALQPFVSVEPNLIVASPCMVFTSNPERNFRALVERLPSKGRNEASDLLAPAMTTHLAEIAKKAGFQAATNVEIRTGDGSTDIDLLLWSQQERFVVSAECKWMIETADLMEVANRGITTASKSLSEQLPKHRKALDKSSSDILKRAFDTTANVESHDSILISRGFCGSHCLPCEFPLIDDRLFAFWLGTGRSLRDISKLCHSKSYLPSPSVDYEVVNQTIRTPSGITLIYPEIRFVTGDPFERSLR